MTSDPIPERTAPEAVGRRLVLAACIGFILISSIEGTIVATVMPQIVGDLGDFDLFSWVFTAYLLVQAVIIPIYGRLADVYGRRRMLLVAVGVFAVGSVLCGCAWNMLSLILFRVVQGVGSGGLVPVSQTVIGDLYTPTERAKIAGWLSSVWALGSILGPLIGAFLIAHTIWPMVFWINVPIAAAAALMVVLWLKEALDHRERRIDYRGAAFLTLGNTVLMFALVQAGHLGLATLGLLLVLSLVLLVLFFRSEQRAAEPMLPIELLKNRTVAASSLGGLFSGAILMGATAFISLYVQGVMGESAFVAGLVLTTPSVTWVIGSASGGWLMLRSTYRMTIIAGGLLLVAGGLILVALRPGLGPLIAATGTGLVGIGMGLTMNAFTVATQGSVGWAQRGVATSTISFTRQVGQALGAAIFGGTINVELAKQGAGADIVDRSMNPALRGAVPTDTLAALASAIASGLHQVYWITLALGFAVAATAFLLPPRLSPRLEGERSRS
ncbi:MAG TPA: MDR family MFS transporter [Stellaceae bacterium]|nr:MDR family MFS transporter [Stellaceae bacterium]